MKKMPNLVGKSVTHARLKLPLATQYVYVDHKSRKPDITFYSNWMVCKQEPAAGAQMAPYVVLTVIKRGETCKVSH
ncbi:PASTA domain-containing protein [Kutzneria chonburiensis]|uniref:PASTA domain-containing protein n=1 Tax=Kutzneria chonburiensis TaxID=1483604 RepID=A0ABV6MS13_9PSEU|nr:PASTA domain-containing protein [Kutzneria chonburiensis]